ncbi:MAG: RNA polymerase sigma factor [Sandaracinaceae bacterium]|nr:RNA polymerase sigma factor [Sandaracinaceae bacterium]
MAEPSDEELMAAYVGGDPAAFRALFARYAPILLRLTIRHLRSEELAREVVQQTFFQMHAARRDFDADKKLRPWLFTIAMNLVRGHFRQRKRRPEAPLEAVSEPAGERDDTEAPLERRQRIERVRAAIAALPDGQREVIVLHWFEERPFAEVAAILGSTEGAVRVRAHRAYRRLEELLDEERE